jgi:Ser/Thr protein kinase RdoA (MazF antagonist)
MTESWLRGVAAQFGITGGLQRLGGECDLNFRGRTAQGEVIVKAMHPQADPALVERQCAAIGHALAADPALPLPRLLPAGDGRFWQTIADEQGRPRLVWVQRALDGIPMGEAGPQPPAFLSELGALAARLDLALRDFKVAAAPEVAKWDLTQAGWITPHLARFAETRRNLLAEIVDAYEAARPVLDRLPRQAIHNDLNDFNILIRPRPGEPGRITGLIDFGDMTLAPRICEIAIAAAYAILDQEAPEAALTAFVAGYHAFSPLGADEIGLIWPLLRMRLAVSVVNSTVEAESRPDDPYVTISQAPAWRLLENPAIDGTAMVARLHEVAARHLSAQPMLE